MNFRTRLKYARQVLPIYASLNALSLFKKRNGFKENHKLIYRETDITFIGVAHTHSTIERYGKILFEDIRRANVVVCETPFFINGGIPMDMDLWKDLRKKGLGMKDDFFPIIYEYAEKSMKKIRSFEPAKIKVDFKLNHASFIFLSSFSTLGIAFYNITENIVLTTLGLLTCYLNLRTLIYLFDLTRTLGRQFKLRNVLAVKGIKDLIEKEKPENLTVIYGLTHISVFLTYFQNPDLFVLHAKDVGVDLEKKSL